MLAVAAVSLVAFVGDDAAPDATRIALSRPVDVTVSSPGRGEPLAEGDAVPSFSAPGFRVATDAIADDPSIGREPVAWSPGEPTVVAIWAPWCPVCQEELPVLDRVAEHYPEVAFVTVVTAIGANPGPDAGAFMADHGITMPTAIDDTEGTLAAAFGIRGFPTLYFVGSDGTVSTMSEGLVEEDALREMIDGLT